MRATRGPRLLLTAAVGCVLLPAPALLTSAHASASRTVSVPLSQASWFWRPQLGAIGNTGIAPPVALADPTVPGGDLAVAGPQTPGVAGAPAGPIAETYLAFDVSAVPEGSTITSFVLTLPVDSGAVGVAPLGTAMVACAPTSSWAGGEAAAPYGGKPGDACDAQSPRLTADPGGKSYHVDIGAIAQRWVRPDGLNLGVAITDNPASTLSAYQVVFGPSAALAHLTASVSFQPPASGATPAPTGGSTPPVPPAAPGTPTGVTGSSAPGLVSVVPVEPLPTGLPPDVAAGTEPPSAVSPVVAAQVRPAGPSAPPIGFWFALVLVVLLLGTTTLVLADPNVARRVVADRGVARALRARHMMTRPSQEIR